MVGPRTDDAAEDYDVMASEPMDDGEDWDANEMGRSQGEEETDPSEFAPDEEEEELEAEAEEVDEDDQEAADDDEDEGDEDDDDEGPEPIDPPSNWPVQEQQFFRELPPQLQHAYMQRAQHMVADYTRKTQRLAQVQQAYQEFDRVIQPHTQKWALNGMNPAQAVSQLIALSDFATNDPAGFIKYFSGIRGVDLQSLANPAQEEYIDPQVAVLRRQQAEVQARLNQIAQMTEQSQQVQQQQYQQQVMNTTLSAIDQFASQTDRDGKPLYPHFDEVLDEMTALINAGVRSVPEAYRKAVRMNDRVFSKEQARSRAAENARLRAETARARRAAASVHGASGSNGAFVPEDMSIRDTLLNAWAGNL